MSFDLKLDNGDLFLSSTNDIAKVVNQDKLIQDVLKMLFTATGEHKLHQWYGTPLLAKVVGNAVDRSLLKQEVVAAINYGLNNLKLLQEFQVKDRQLVSAKEQMAKILDIDCWFDPLDNRKLVIKFTILAKSNEVATESFSISA